MTKHEFMLTLQERLTGLSEEDMEQSLDYYSEMIDDRIEDGLSQEEAVAAVGDPAEIAGQILSDLPLGKLVKANLKSRRTLRTWEILLLVLGSPVWLPLLVSALVVILAIYVSIWSVVISLYATDLALAVSAVACVPVGVGYAVGGSMAVGTAAVGCALILAGLSIFMFLGCNQVAKGSLWLGKVILHGIKSCFIRKETAK